MAKLHSSSRSRLHLAGLLALATACVAASSAEARPARCFTTDEGFYSCDFHPTDKNGSFEISAPGKPTYLMNVDEPGVASAFVNFGPRNVFLPGKYRSIGDAAGCWLNDTTHTKICAQ